MTSKWLGANDGKIDGYDNSIGKKLAKKSRKLKVQKLCKLGKSKKKILVLFKSCQKRGINLNLMLKTLDQAFLTQTLR